MQSKQNILEVDRVWKKFCRNLRRAMWYGLLDVGNQLKFSRPSLQPRDLLRAGEFFAVKDATFSMQPGECIGLIGPNGAGKSTLLKMITGLIRPDSGQIRIRGRVGALIELGTGFNLQLSGRENILINGTVLGLSKREIDRALEGIIEFAELGSVIDDPIKTYSSGMRMRLGFSVAAHLRPQLLILDEVLAVGDVRFRMKCFQHFNDLVQQGTSIVLVTHAVSMLPRVATRVIVCESGRIAYDGEVQKGLTIYEQGLVEQASQIGNRADQHWTNARIANASVLDDSGRVRNEFQTGETIVLRLELECEQTIPDARVIAAVGSPGAETIASMSTPYQNFQFDLCSGRSTVELKLERVPLLLGAYYFDVSLYGRQLTDFCHRRSGIGGFRIVGPAIDVNGNGISGLIKFDHSWRRVDPDEAS